MCALLLSNAEPTDAKDRVYEAQSIRCVPDAQARHVDSVALKQRRTTSRGAC